MGRLSNLKKRVLEIKYKTHENHIGSCLTAVPIIASIYDKMKKNDKFILSAGHAGVALYAVLEEKGIIPKNKTYKLESHPKRNEKYQIWASTGSLGHGIGIAVGMAMATKDNVYCLLTDGECAEGSVWEALQIASELKLTNLHVYVNANGLSGLGYINLDRLQDRLEYFSLDIVFIRQSSDILPYYTELDAHYKSLTKDQYEELISRRTL